LFIDVGGNPLVMGLIGLIMVGGAVLAAKLTGTGDIG
jgi:hypothetical protein